MKKLLPFIPFVIVCLMAIASYCFAADGSIPLDAAGTGSIGGIGSGTGSLALGAGSVNNTVDMSRGFEVSIPAGWTKVDTQGYITDTSTDYAHDGSQSMKTAVTGTYTAYEYYDMGGTKAHVTASFWHRMPSITAAGANLSIPIFAISSANTGGSYNCEVYMDYVNSTVNYGYKFRGATGPTRINSSPTLTAGNWYRSEIDCVQNGTSSATIYDSNGNSLGSISLTANNNNARYIIGGAVGAATTGQSYTAYFDSIGVLWSSPWTTPLWPFAIGN